MCIGKAPRVEAVPDTVIDLGTPGLDGYSTRQKIMKMLVRQYARYFHHWTKVAVSVDTWQVLLETLIEHDKLERADEEPAIKLFGPMGYSAVVADPHLKAEQLKLLEVRYA